MSETLTRVEINCETGEQIVRPFTAAEIAQYEIDQANSLAWEQAREADKAAREAAKASAEAKLAALGLTPEEIAAL
jgi:hypothetical protein